MKNAFSFNRTAPILVLCVEAKQPLVQVGGKSLRDLREDFFDASNSIGVCSPYDTALSGGEPYATWID